MTTMLITFNGTRENGNFMGDQLCSLKAAHLFVENQPGVEKVIMTMSPGNEMTFLWKKFVEKHDVHVIWDDWNPGDWSSRHQAWDQWRNSRKIDGIPFDDYRELYLRIHGGTRQNAICGSERGLGRKNIFEYWFYGQEDMPDSCSGSDWFDDTLCYHPELKPTRDVYISPHCKTQGNFVFTFDYWGEVVHRLIDEGVSVTVGYEGDFCWDLYGHPLYQKHWGTHEQWFDQVCSHRVVACGNTGTGWVAAACGVPLFTMEPPNSQMPDHRYRECGLRNIVEVMSEPDAAYCVKQLVNIVKRRVVMTTGCYDILHAGHVRHLERARTLGTKLIVALNSDESVSSLKGAGRPINPEGQRRAVLEALRCVDEVRIFDGADATLLMEEIRPDVLAVGYGYTTETVIGRDLVESWGGSVVITSQGDAMNEPSTTKTLNRILKSGDISEICRIGAAYSVNPVEKLRLMAYEFLSVANLDGDVADLGTCKGGSGLVLRRLCPSKHLHLFDTWAGTPYSDPLCHHKQGEWETNIEGCKQVVGQDELTHYHQGVFPEWDADNCRDEGYRPAREHFFCFVYIDMDTYQATKDAIEFFWPLLIRGAKMVVDDFGWLPCAGTEKAVLEAFPCDQHQDFDRKIVQNLYTCVVTKK